MFALAFSTAMYATSSLAMSSDQLFPRNKHHRRVKFNSTAMQVMQVEGPPSNGPSFVPVFDAGYAKRERRTVLSKYVTASNSIKGIGLSPMESIPFAENYPVFEDPAMAASTTNYISEPGALIPSVPVLSKMPLTDYMAGTMDVMYYGPLRFGSNGQNLAVDFDTGSADLWVLSNCTDCDGDQYDMRGSATHKDLKQDFSVSYGQGEAEGRLVEDTVTISGIPVKHQAFGAVHQESPDFEGYPNSGILGCAFASISSSGRRTVFDNLMANGQVAAPFFSVHLARNQVKGSEVCLGCYDATKTKGPVTWVPLKSKTYWSVQMNGLRHNSTAMLKTDLIAAIDTGTTLIYVPDRVAREFYQSIPGAKTCKQIGPGFFCYPCSTKLDVALVFDGKKFSVSSYDFNLGRLSSESTDCVGGVVSLGGGFPDTIAIIGDEFLKSWYSVYDYSNGARVGFAPSVNN